MLYFSYGSNMNLERMKTRRTEFEFRTGAVLENYKLTFDKVAGYTRTGETSMFPKVYGLPIDATIDSSNVIEVRQIKKRPEFQDPSEGYANVVPSAGDHVEGALYVMPPEGIKLLDGHEGCPEHYTREFVTVVCSNGTRVEAICYIANPKKVETNLLPSDTYLAHLLKGRDVMTTDYFNKLVAQKTISEYSTAGYNRNRAYDPEWNNEYYGDDYNYSGVSRYRNGINNRERYSATNRHLINMHGTDI